MERALAKRRWSRAELARRVGCSPPTITNLLNGNVEQSPFVPMIHVALEWSPPIASDNEDVEAVVDMLAKMTEIGKARWIERGQAILDEEKKNKR